MMTSAIEQIADGTSAFFERQLSLDVLGTKIDDDGQMTSRDALVAANLHDWNMRLVPAFGIEQRGSESVATGIDGKFAVVRDVWPSREHDVMDDVATRGLGIVGSKYELVQNEDAFELVDALFDVAGERIPFEYAGSRFGGRRVFVGLKLPKQIMVGGHDAVDMRLLMTNTNDGTQPFTLALHVNRLGCTNAIEMTRRNAKRAQQSWSIRHTSSISGRVQQARETLQLTFAAVDEIESEMSELYAKRVSPRQFERLVENVFPIDTTGTKKAREATQQTRLAVRTIYRESPTQRDIHGNAWGALNAFVEYADWARDVRPGKLDAAEARAIAQLDSRHVANFKASVMDRVLAMA